MTMMSIRNRGRTLLAVLLAVLSCIVLGFAGVSSSNAAEAQTVDASIPAEVRGMDAYIFRTGAGDLSLDETAAVNAGFSSDAIATVFHQIGVMNDLLDNNASATLSDDYTVTVLYPTPRARGVNKVVTHWYGLTEVWMDSDKAQELIRNLEMGQDVGSALGGIAGNIIQGYFYVSVASVKNAAAPGRGIIMYSQYNAVVQAQNIWFASQ